MLTLLLGWLFGLAQGVRHAFEPDHIAAVSTIVAEQKTARASMGFAFAWGIGHMLVLLVVGGSLVVVRAHMPDSLGDVFELAVAVMLVVLGVRALRTARARKASATRAAHQHHAAPHTHGHPGGWPHARRPLLIGCIHGLAGSGALTALVLAKLTSPVVALVYMGIYGFGATLGMATLAGLAGVPLAHLAKNPRGMPILLGVTGAVSLVLGFAWGLPIAVRMAGG